jgi:hypothetical protein
MMKRESLSTHAAPARITMMMHYLFRGYRIFKVRKKLQGKNRCPGVLLVIEHFSRTPIP